MCLERGLGAVMIKLLDDVDWLSGFNILEPGVCPYFSKKKVCRLPVGRCPT
jgi:hypothetical protein